MGSCVEVMLQGWIGQKKKVNLVAMPYLFLLQQRFDQSYATNLLWNIYPNFLANFRLKQAFKFEKIIKHQTALKFEF